jgi:hypothetical protein
MTQEDAEGTGNDKPSRFARIKTAVKNARNFKPFGSSRGADLSTLLSDLKHVSEDGSSFASNIDSADADAPPI